MAFVEDFTPFLADFGQVAVLDNVEVRVIFDNDYADPNGMATTMPRAQLPAASATRANQGSTLRLASGASYLVRSVERDGTGWCSLMLELVR